MRIKRVSVVFFSLFLIEACTESELKPQQSHSGLTCLSFQDETFFRYAMTNWDFDHDGCLSKSEANTINELPANSFAGNTSLLSVAEMFYKASKFNQDISGWSIANADIKASDIFKQSGMSMENYCSVVTQWQCTADLGMSYTCN